MNTITILEKCLAEARRRLFLQRFLDRLIVCWAIALGVGIAWVLLRPFLPPIAILFSNSLLLGGLGTVGAIAAAIWSVRTAPTRTAAALAIDRRFGLQERVITALAMSAQEAATSAGEALLADAAARLTPVSIRSRFSIALGRRALVLPAQALILIVAIFFWKPLLGQLQADNDPIKPTETAKTENNGPGNAAKSNPPRPIVMPANRSGRSEELQKLEEELKKLYADASKPNDPAKQEQIAQKLEKVAVAEDQLRKFEQRQVEKLQRLQDQLRKLGQLESGQSSKDGPAKDLSDDLSKGDISKAKEDVDQLKKKVKDKKLDPKDAEQLKQQAQDLQDKLERLSRKQEEQKKLQNLIDKAKREGRDAESLEREMKQLQDEVKQLEAMKKLADKLGDIAKSLEMNDLDGVEKNLGDLSKQLEQLGDMAGDLDDVDEHLQNLKGLRKQLAKEMQGQCDGDGRTEEETKGGGRGQATGKRPENPDANTDFEEQRQRARFDPRGRKRYAGAVNGPAFTKKSTLELVGEIKQAAQEAPNAVEVQRLPRSAREMVKEYFENLGGEKQKEP
jgi:hypothetical protein